MYHRSSEDRIQDGILGCHCCSFPVVDGIPVLHLMPAAVAARGHIEAGRPTLALSAMVDLADDSQARRFEAAAAAETSTYKDVVESLGPGFEGGYFLYRFSDPTYVVAHAVVRAVARAVLGGKGRAIDVCGGSGHLTRSLLDMSISPPVLADLSFPKVWLGRRFTAPGCEPVCCDANAPLPFARGAFGCAICSDALHYIWMKRQFIGELCRLVDERDPGAVVISHMHNQLVWSPSHGQTLPVSGYRDLFEAIEPHIYGETALLADVVRGGPLDLARRDGRDTLDADPAVTIVASRDTSVYRQHRLDQPGKPVGEFRINPLYAADDDGTQVRLRLRFPDADYESEYHACRQYLPDEVVVDRSALAGLGAAVPDSSLAELVRRRVIIDLPARYC